MKRPNVQARDTLQACACTLVPRASEGPSSSTYCALDLHQHSLRTATRASPVRVKWLILVLIYISLITTWGLEMSPVCQLSWLFKRILYSPSCTNLTLKLTLLSLGRTPLSLPTSAGRWRLRAIRPHSPELIPGWARLTKAQKSIE